MGRRIIAIIAATVLALVGALLVLLYARGSDQRAIQDAQPVTAYVSKALIPSGTTLEDAIRDELLVKTQVAAKGLPAGALRDVTDKNKRLIAVTTIPPGTYVLSASFGTTQTSTEKIAVPPGMLGVAVQLTDPAHVGSFVTTGSRITVFETMTLKRVGASEEVKQFNELDVKGTQVVLENAEVIGMGNTSNAPVIKSTGNTTVDNAETASFLVTVAVTPQQAADLIHAVNNYVVYAAIRGTDVEVNPRTYSWDLNRWKGPLK